MSGNRNRTVLRPRGAWIAIAVLITMHALMFYGLTGTQVFWISMVYAALALMLGAFRSLVGALGLAAGTVVAAVLVQAGRVEASMHFRPTDLATYTDYSRLLERYLPDLDLTMPAQGNLAPSSGGAVHEERSIVFRTDPSGWRNDQAYRGEPWLALGGGFVAGEGNTQADLLTARLERDHGLPVYGIAHGGDLLAYERYLQIFDEAHGEQPPAFLFLFEGTDFPEFMLEPEVFGIGSVDHLRKRYTRMFSGTALYRVGRLVQERARSRGIFAEVPLLIEEDSPVGPIAFDARTVAVTERPEALEPPAVFNALARMQPRLAGVFFVPTKYRVFRRTFHPEEALPDVNRESLARHCDELQLPFVDLTEPLVRRAGELASEGRFPYWRDDTHWNAEGIAVAARAVADLVAGLAEGEEPR